MSKIDKVVLRETAYITVWTLIFSALLQSVFLMIGKWDIYVLLGNIYGATAAILNFFVMGLSIQKALTKDPKDVKAFIKATGTVRLVGLVLVAVIGVLLPLNTLAVIIPLLFPRAAITLRPFFAKRMDADVPAVSGDGESGENENNKADEQNELKGGADNE